MIVVTGAEILAGAYADAHTFFLTRTLCPLGYHCIGSLTVDDRPADIKEAMSYASRRAPLVVVTGGLGPTDNDITRQTLSDFTQIPLEEHAEVIGAMEKRFGLPRDQLRANLRQQARIPVRGTFLPSTQGTAVGLVFAMDPCTIVALPGPPRELQSMVQGALVPYLTRRFGARAPGCAITVRFVGLGQSQIDQTLDEQVHLPADVSVTSQFEGGRVDFSFLLPEDTPDNRSRLEEIRQRIQQHLGDYVYANDAAISLEDSVVARLESRHARLAVAEIASGGCLAASLNGTAAAERVMAASVSAHNQEQLRSLLGVPEDDVQNAATHEDRLRTLAARISTVTGGNCALVVGDTERTAEGLTALVAFLDPDGRYDVRRFGIASNDPMRTRLITSVWDHVRRLLRTEKVGVRGSVGVGRNLRR